MLGRLEAEWFLAKSGAGVAQLVERQPSKLNVEGSSPFARFLGPRFNCPISHRADQTPLGLRILGSAQPHCFESLCMRDD